TLARASARDGVDDGLEPARIVEGEVREDLAIELDAGLLHGGDELAVAHAVRAGRGVDARDPQGAVVALLGAAVGVGVRPGVAQLLHGGGEGVSTREVVTPRVLQDAIATTAGLEAPLCARHLLAPLELVGEQPLDAELVRAVDEGVLLELAEARGALPAHEVLLAGGRAADLAAPRRAEALCSGPLGLHLGHVVLAFELADQRETRRRAEGVVV